MGMQDNEALPPPGCSAPLKYTQHTGSVEKKMGMPSSSVYSGGQVAFPQQFGTASAAPPQAQAVEIEMGNIPNGHAVHHM